MKNNIIIIGSSQIINSHIISLSKYFKIKGIYTTNKNSKNIYKIAKKYKIKEIYFNLEKCLSLNNNVNTHFLVAPRIKDTVKISLNVLKKTKGKILIEKPISTQINDIKKLKTYSTRIFVGYNRLFYSNVNYLKEIFTKQNKKMFCYCSLPEKSKTNVITNTCHTVSILFFLFGDLRIVFTKKTNEYLFSYIKSKKCEIFIKIYFNAFENFKIDINTQKMFYKFNTIEKLEIYNGLKVKKSNQYKTYSPIKIKTIDEFKKNNFKPGFLNQSKEFYNFVKIKRYKYINNVSLSLKIINICRKLLN